VVGVGLGASVQKLFYLPEAHTDFVFAVLAEELGLIGIVMIVGLFVILVGARSTSRGSPATRSRVPVVPRVGVWPLDRPAGVHQHRREHGSPCRPRA